jgi:hypothetical protein
MRRRRRIAVTSGPSHLEWRVDELAGLPRDQSDWQGHRLMIYSQGSLDGGEWSPDCTGGGGRGAAGLWLSNRAVPYPRPEIMLCVAMDIACPVALSPSEAVPRAGKPVFGPSPWPGPARPGTSGTHAYRLLSALTPPVAGCPPPAAKVGDAGESEGYFTSKTYASFPVLPRSTSLIVFAVEPRLS